MNRMKAMVRAATASAPASVGNVSVGFDVLGHSLHGPVDHATVRLLEEPIVRVSSIDAAESFGASRAELERLPREPERNTAGMALLSLRERIGLEHGFELEIMKGIPLAAGLGGSAASAVAAVVAAGSLLSEAPSRSVLYESALDGEAVASGCRHGDNVAASLWGGLVFCGRERVFNLALPADLSCVVVHPDVRLETRVSREALAAPYELQSFVQQSEHLIQFVAGCERGDLELIRSGLKDTLVEPRRAELIPGLPAVKKAALEHGALGAGISGGGPSVFAWFPPGCAVEVAAGAMVAAFQAAGHASVPFISPLVGPRAEVVS